MGADKITSKILEDAERNANSIKSEAQMEADKILEDAKKEAEKRKNEIIKKGEKEAEMIKNRIIAEARLNAKKMMLKEREKLIGMAVEKLKEDLTKLPGKGEYKTLLSKLIIEGITSVGGGEVILELNEKDYKEIDSKKLWEIENKVEELLKKPTIVKKGNVVNIIGGCIVKTNDNSKICNNSLEAVFERNLDDIKVKVAELLF